MTARPIVLLLVASLFALPSVSAEHDCSAEAGAIDLGDVIVAGDLSVWEDSNGVDGLQRASCGPVDDNGRHSVRADVRSL